ncbi:putative F-box protein At4g10190 [Arabidopsis lyrata subsp. lyrata]|nr:putative F-box protein At4g10190 [Arabidopsis lyrata subsp. lyrata]|eukprot:XP_002883624.2 putative F-box protein At4g10190 [Arabidopsis lyrata subsp. lyrata]
MRNMNEMMLKKRSTNYLPEDLVVEILSRVPLTSLARLRWACKGWNDLIKDKILAMKPSQIIVLIDSRVYLASVDMHKIDNNKVNLTSQFSLKDPLSHNFSEEVDIQNVFHCDGLLCTTKDDRLVVWNPLSRETRWIQPRSTNKEFEYFALGISSSNKYKILRIVHTGKTHPGLLEFEIYDFTSNSWKVISESRDWLKPLWKSCVMSVNGNIYWLAFREGDGIFLQSFDFSTERFRRVSLPGDHHYYNILSLAVTREKQQLCLLTQDRQVPANNVWIATKIESKRAASWIKFLSFDLPNFHHPFHFCSPMNFLVDRENKVLVCPGKNNGVSNNFLNILGENKFIQVDHQDGKSVCSLLVNYVPTFVQIHQGSLK